MRDIQELLRRLTVAFPPQEGMRHNITLDERGMVVLSVWTSSKDAMGWSLEEGDYGKPIDALASEFIELQRDYIAGGGGSDL
jgi:hypothetical protein